MLDSSCARRYVRTFNQATSSRYVAQVAFHNGDSCQEHDFQSFWTSSCMIGMQPECLVPRLLSYSRRPFASFPNTDSVILHDPEVAFKRFSLEQGQQASSQSH